MIQQVSINFKSFGPGRISVWRCVKALIPVLQSNVLDAGSRVSTLHRKEITLAPFFKIHQEEKFNDSKHSDILQVPRTSTEKWLCMVFTCFDKIFGARQIDRLDPLTVRLAKVHGAVDYLKIDSEMVLQVSMLKSKLELYMLGCCWSISLK